MANRRAKHDADAEIDLHGMTVEEMRHTLEQRWSEWRGLTRVRVIHGRGEALKPALQRWCSERGIPFAIDPGNPGSTRLFPTGRELQETRLGTSLRDKGLFLTPEEEDYLRNPQNRESKEAEQVRLRIEEARRKADLQAREVVRKPSDEALWTAEVARLDALQKRHGGSTGKGAEKPGAPVIVPPSEIKHQEGYWRAELVRVADSDNQTLRKQKKTGLDKLAPPLERVPTADPMPSKDNRKSEQEVRDAAADAALFEEEIARLDDGDARSVRRQKHRSEEQ